MFEIYINNNKVAEVSGCEAAWEYFEMAKTLVDTMGGRAKLVEVHAISGIRFKV